MGEVARALEVNPNVLHRWRREFRQGQQRVSRLMGSKHWSEGRITTTERLNVSRGSLQYQAINRPIAYS